METNVVRNAKFVKVIGVITTTLFLSVSVFLILTGNLLASLFFLPFAALGIILILAYKKEKILLEKESLTICRLFGKTQQVDYREIRCLLLIPLRNRTRMVLVDKQYRRLLSLDPTLENPEILLEVLIDNEIPLVDFGEMAQQKKNLSRYFPLLTAIERNYYHAIVDETKVIEQMSKNSKAFYRVKAKKRLKIIGWILIALDVAAYLSGGKPMMLLLTGVLLAAYTVYLWYYPYIYIETTTKKGEEQALQMPCLGAAAAILLCLGVAQTFIYDSGVSFKITLALTVLLALPYLIKSAKTKLPQRLGRKLSVIFAAFILAFSITFPLNFLLTFDKARHETVTITDKHISTSGKTDDYYLHGYWNGEETKFRVSSSVYRDTDIGEERRICIRQSALGMVYYSICLLYTSDAADEL